MGDETEKPSVPAQQYVHVLRAILESPRDIVIFALDRAYRYIAFNEAHRTTMHALWNVDIEVGQNMLDVIAREDDRAKAKANFDRALAGDHFVLVEEYGDEAASRRFYEDIYSPILGSDGSVIGLTLFLTDISEQRQNERQLDEYRRRLELLVEQRTADLARSEELYRSLVTNAPMAVVVHRGAEIRYVNPAAAALWGEWKESKLIGRSLDDLVAGGSTVLAEASEVTVIRVDSTEAEAEWRSIPVQFEGSPATLSLALDVSARKRAEREQRRFEEKLLHAQKLESLGLLAGGVAHDFNNLLVGVLGNADLALRLPEATGELRAHLERIKASAVLAAELTRQMLAYSGKGPVVVRTLDLDQLTREMTNLVSISLPAGARLEVDLAGNLPGFEGDAAQVRQIIMNLVTNAADAITEGGTIRVRTFEVDANRDTLSVAHVDDALSPGRYVGLEVSDDGVGMNDETRARLFDPFFTTKAKGRGLGLAAVLGIVRAHSGAISVVSAPGRGSTFRVLFPRSERAIRSEIPAPELPWRGEGVVIVADDHPRVRNVLRMMLTDVGFEVLEAESAQRCLELYRENAGRINAIMADLMMPGGGGGEVVRVLRAGGSSVPVVLSSGYSKDMIGPEIRSDPHVAFLEKPFELSTLVRVLRGALAAQ